MGGHIILTVCSYQPAQGLRGDVHIQPSPLAKLQQSQMGEQIQWDIYQRFWSNNILLSLGLEFHKSIAIL